MNRKKLFGIIEKDNQHNTLSRVYDLMMLVFILLSIVPLIFIEDFPIFRYIEIVTFVVFVSDYILRWITADYKLNYKGWSFLLYPFTPMAIVDLLSILPCLNAIGSSFKIFRIKDF